MSPELVTYLKRCGLSRGKLERCDGDTRMYHDLGIYGDIAETYMDVLVNEYGVNLDGFEFERYFPPEYPGKNLLSRVVLWLVPGAGAAARGKGDYQPLKLATLECVLETKRWVDCVG